MVPNLCIFGLEIEIEIFPQIFCGARAGHTCSGDFDRFTARAVGFIFSNIVGVLSSWKG